MKSVLVIDIEATCWKDNEVPDDQEQEIIEIGLATVKFEVSDNDYLFARMEPDSLIVRPERSEVSSFLTELTGITPEVASGGLSFGDAMERLGRIAENHFAWASWGEWDKRKLREQCADRGVRYPLPYHHLNVKSAWAMLRGREQVGLAEAVRESAKKFIGNQHRGSDDALNTAHLLRDIIRKHNQGG